MDAFGCPRWHALLCRRDHFSYALVPTFDASPDCLSFLDRAAAGIITVSTNVQVWADVLHKSMTSETAQLTGRDISSMVGYLKRHPEIIERLSQWPLTIRRLNVVPMTLLGIDVAILEGAMLVAKSFGLLTNDATIVALMQQHGITHLTTNDDDFDRVPGLTIWKPRP